MKRSFIFSLFLFFISISSYSQDPTRWEEEVSAYEKSDSAAVSSTDAVFTGSSSIRLWKDLPQQFPTKKVLNRGIGGSEISDIVYYADRLIFKYKPSKLFIYCGGNDIWNGKSPEQVFSDFSALYEKVRTALPKTKIYYISIQNSPSRVEKTASFVRANELIKQFLSSTSDTFIDVYPLLLDKNGKPQPEYFIEDQLHMNSKGYDKWTPVIGKELGR